MSPLHLYRASAGSGKTYALTLEYLKLMFRNPGAHRSILAVTFTNRAAGEMKSRILGRLHALSTADDPCSIRETEGLMEVSGLDEEGVKERAGMLLNRILNDYSWFSVGTIDRFFQSVIRAFTHEIGIQPGYNLELDHPRILSLAVERLFQELGSDEMLQRWLIRYAEERMEESRSWNFRNDMVELGLQLFRESFQGMFLQQGMQSLDKENLQLFQQQLDEVEARMKDEITGTGHRALGEMEQRGLAVEDFRLKSNSPPSVFREAYAGNELQFSDAKLAAMDDPGKWLKKDADAEMERLTVEVLMPLYRLLHRHQVVLNTIHAIRRNIYTLGILGDIWERVRQHTSERNLFLIADSGRFLKGIIGANQVPFIYERTGNRYNHIMLDEFQDTSVFQYDNFRPLLDHSLAGGYFNLVVGDVKQSIYRWRNSDWNILAGALESDFRHQKIEVHHLNRNFRSLENVIRFNNSVFQLAPGILAEQIENELLGVTADRELVSQQVSSFTGAYDDAVQQFRLGEARPGGAVRLELFREEEEEGFRETVLRRIPAWLNQVMESGIQPGEIAILVRNRREGTLVAGALLEHARESPHPERFRLVSGESLLLEYNQAITLILSALQYLAHPDDPLNSAVLKYFSAIRNANTEQIPPELFDSSISPASWLGDAWSSGMQKLRNLPLYELVEALIDLFGLDKNAEDLPYLQAFQDVVIDLQRRESMGISEFLHYWEQFGTLKGVAGAEDSNAIRIMTIHKAKGLEFRAVIIPFCNWEITTDQRKANILWCETEGTPFTQVPLVPVRFGSHLKQTLFSPQYYQERMRGYMDNLNLMYVAFTRAEEVIYLGVPEGEGERLNNVGDLVRSLLTRTPGKDPALRALNSYRNGQVVEVGELPRVTMREPEPDSWQFTTYPVMRRTHPMRVRMRSDQYFVDEGGSARSGRMFGNVMHLVFSRIDALSDVDPVVASFRREGLLPGDSAGRLKTYIHERIVAAGVEEWFSGGDMTVYKERSILCGGGTIIRPDRVMVRGDTATVVDFKFGEMESARHSQQVAGYMQHLSSIGYRGVKGYVWYVNSGKLVQIPST